MVLVIHRSQQLSITDGINKSIIFYTSGIKAVQDKQRPLFQLSFFFLNIKR